MLPKGQGGMIWFEWDYQNQNRNWHHTSSAPAADNDDQQIKTSFFSGNLQYLFSDSWGVQVEVPFAHRYFKHLDETTGELESTAWTALGDVRLKGLYTGFFKDLSAGIDVGVKLPTGHYTHPGVDRDTQIGTGSTDLLFGGYYRTPISTDHNWTAFSQLAVDIPVVIKNDYRPGFEVSASLGVDYVGFAIGNVNFAPLAQVILSGRGSDSGANSAQPVATGYERVLLSLGLEIVTGPFMLYGDVEVPVWQDVRGNQLVAPALFKFIIGYSF
jgi:hypothetical protein